MIWFEHTTTIRGLKVKTETSSNHRLRQVLHILGNHDARKGRDKVPVLVCTLKLGSSHEIHRAHTVAYEFDNTAVSGRFSA